MNWDNVKTLLDVIHSASAAGPKFQRFAAAASDELDVMWLEEHPAPELVEIPDPPSSADLLPPNELNSAKEPADE
jgi:hypothetical protein